MFDDTLDTIQLQTTQCAKLLHNSGDDAEDVAAPNSHDDTDLTAEADADLT